MKKIFQNKCNRLLPVLVALLSFITAHAQNGTLQGMVKDAGGNYLTGASITIKGNTKGSSTDISGHYSISLQPGTYTVRVSTRGRLGFNVPALFLFMRKYRLEVMSYLSKKF
jgi:hypothetical protein